MFLIIQALVALAYFVYPIVVDYQTQATSSSAEVWKWPIVCTAGPDDPHSCSTSAKFVGEEEGRVKIEAFFNHLNGRVVLRFILPPEASARKTITLAHGQGMLGTLYLDACEPESCVATWQVGLHALADILISRMLVVEYATSDKEGMRLGVPTEGLRLALLDLAKLHKAYLEAAGR